MSHEDAPALDPEELAAYIDGRLSGTRKARVEEALARNEDDYEVFLESVRTLEAEGLLDNAEPRTDTVVDLGERSSPPRRQTFRWVPAASGLLAASLAATLGLWFLTAGMSPADFAKQTRTITISETEDWDDPQWKRFRSAERLPPDQYTDGEIAFRLGVRGVDLRVAGKTGDPELLRNLARNTGYWATGADLVPSEIAFDDIVKRLEAAEGTTLPEDIDQQLDAAEAEVAADVAVDPLMKRRYRLGLWAETGRLAALAGDAETLRSRRFRWHRTGLARNDPDRTEAAERVAAIKERLKAEPRTEADHEALRQQFGDLIYLLAG